MQDDVLNRRLFNRGSTAARDRVRKMGGVQEPQGILASYQELMQAVRPQRGQGLMPMIMQDARPIQPVRMQEGGDLALEAFRQGAVEPTLGQQFAAIQGQAMAQPVDIAATPTPRAPVEVPDIASMVRANLSGDEAALAAFDNLEGTLTNPESTPEDVQEAVTSAAGVENTADGMRSVVSAITGREQPADATVDELNRAIMGVSLGGAIGGPRSVAERISNALLVGLQAQRETATTREAVESSIRVAAAGGGRSGRSGMSPLEPFPDAVRELAGRLITQNPRLTAQEAMQQARDALAPYYTSQGGGTIPAAEQSTPTIDQHRAANDAAKQAGQETYTLGGAEYEVQ